MSVGIFRQWHEEINPMSNKNSLDVYWGGLLLNSSLPLEVQLNYCSHSCSYCFGNLNTPDRRTKWTQITNLLDELHQTTESGEFKRKTYAAELLRDGYPVIISNHVDPLATSNAFQALPLIERLQQENIPVSIMTKFGKRKDTEAFFDLLDKPIALYVSLSTLDPKIVRDCEPGAPLPDDRLHWISEAVGRGHSVTVGINPIIPGWIYDPEKMVQLIAETGAQAICTGKIHLSKKQIANMPDKSRERFGEYALDCGLNHRKHPELKALYQRVIDAIDAVGIPRYSAQDGHYSEYFEHERKPYQKTLPVMQDFVNHCHKTKQAGDLVYWQEFRDFFVPKLPEGERSLRDHLNAIVLPVALYGKNIPQRMDYETLLWHCWQHTETIVCPANVDCFAWAGDIVNPRRNQWITVTDDEQLPILVFLPEGTNGQAFTDKHNL